MRADLVAAWRSLTASVTFTCVAVTVLALGIGATTAVFAVVDATLLRPLPLPAPDRLVSVREHRPAEDPTNYYPIAPQNFLDWRAAQRAFDAFAALSVRRLTSVSPAGDAEELTALAATADFFDVLGVGLALGRPFHEEEGADGRHRVVVLSHAFWERAFGGDAAALGKSLVLDGEPYEVVGVMPVQAFVPDASDRTDVLVPLVFRPEERTRIPGVSSSYLSVMGRLRAGVSIAAAQAEMDGIAARLRTAYPEWNGQSHVRVVPLLTATVGAEWSSWLWMVFGGAISVLLIACVNVAVLQMTRAGAREHEMSVRAVLGGDRLRLFRQLLVENVVLTLVAAVAAVFVAWASVGVLRSAIIGLPRIAQVAIDLRVLAVMTLAAVMCGLAVGVAPAWFLTGPRLARALQNGGRTVAGRAGRGVTRALVVAEVSLAMVLLVAAALWTRSAVAVLAIDPGFSTARLLMAGLSLTRAPQRDGASTTRGASLPASPPPPDVVSRVQDLVARLEGTPGITRAAFVNGGMPLAGQTLRTGFRLPGRSRGEGAAAVTRYVTDGYFDVLGVVATVGRGFSPADRTGAVRPAVVNDAFVRTYLEGAPPLGHALVLAGLDYEIVGVVPDTRGARIERAIEPEINALITPDVRLRAGEVVVRTLEDPRAAAPFITRVTGEVFPGMPLRRMRTIEDALDQQTYWRRFDMWVANLFGVLGLVIAAVGIYGTLAYAIAMRTREIGVRIALGAAPTAVVRLVGIETGAVVALGTVLGAIGASWVLTRYREHWFEATLSEPASLVLPGLAMVVVAAAAAVVPLWRAVAVDPAEALRSE